MSFFAKKLDVSLTHVRDTVDAVFVEQVYEFEKKLENHKNRRHSQDTTREKSGNPTFFCGGRPFSIQVHWVCADGFF